MKRVRRRRLDRRSARLLGRHLDRHRARRGDESGAHVVEFALVFSLVILPLFMAIIQYGYQYWALQTADAAAREAARNLAVGTDWSCTRSTAIERIDGPAVNAATAPTASMSYAGGVSKPKVGTIVSVRVQFQSLRLGFVPLPGGAVIDRTASARVENVPTTALPCSGN